MLGHSHALSGLAVGAAALPAVPASSFAEQVAWVAAVGGCAMLPDLDTGGISTRSRLPRVHGSTIALTWGPLTCLAAKGVATLFGGHRNGTHSVLGVAAVGLLASLCALTFPTRLLLLALVIGIALRSLAFAIPGRVEETWLANLAVSAGSAWWLLTRGDGSPAWLPAAVVLGSVIHIAGDLLTVGGVPLAWPLSKERQTLSLFKTGARVEQYLLAPAFLLAAGALLWQQVDLPAASALRTLIHRNLP